jgi:hypothetical protein
MNSQEFQLVITYVNELLSLMKKGMELDMETRKMLIEADPKLFVELRKLEIDAGAKAFDRLANSVDNLVTTAIPQIAAAQKELAASRVIQSNNELAASALKADVEMKQLNHKIESERRQQRERSSYTNGTSTNGNGAHR